MTTELSTLPEGFKSHTQKVTVPTTLAFEVPNDPNALGDLREALVSYSAKQRIVPEFLFLLTKDLGDQIKELQNNQETLKQ